MELIKVITNGEKGVIVKTIKTAKLAATKFFKYFNIDSQDL